MSSDAQHFTLEGALEPTAEGRYVDVSAIEPVSFVPGLNFQPVLGEQTMVNVVSFDTNTEAPRHAHAEEQIVLVLEGEFHFDLNGEVKVMRPGDVAVVPPWVPHGAWTTDSTCREVDVFNPPRQTLLDHAKAQLAAREAAAAAAETER